MSDACHCDYEPARVYRRGIHHARSRRICDECGAEIAPGERYELAFGVWETPETFRTCDCCLALREWVAAHVPCFCWAHGSTREDALSAADDHSHEAPGLLFGALRRELAIRRRRAAELRRAWGAAAPRPAADSDSPVTLRGHAARTED